MPTFSSAWDRVTSERNSQLRAGQSPATSGNTELVAAVTGKRIKVVWVLMTNAGASNVSVKFQSATTDITLVHELASEGGGWSMNFLPGFYCQTVVGQALNVNLSGNVQVDVEVGYVLED